MCCSVIVDVMIGVSSKAYSNVCGCLLNEFQLTPLSSQLHEQTVPAVRITCDIHCYGDVKPSNACVCVCAVCGSAGCYKITTVFSHAQTVVLCVGCSTVLCQPTGGKARLTEGMECANLYI